MNPIVTLKGDKSPWESVWRERNEVLVEKGLNAGRSIWFLSLTKLTVCVLWSEKCLGKEQQGERERKKVVEFLSS